MKVLRNASPTILLSDSGKAKKKVGDALLIAKLNMNVYHSLFDYSFAKIPARIANFKMRLNDLIQAQCSLEKNLLQNRLFFGSFWSKFPSFASLLASAPKDTSLYECDKRKVQKTAVILCVKYFSLKRFSVRPKIFTIPPSILTTIDPTVWVSIENIFNTDIAIALCGFYSLSVHGENESCKKRLSSYFDALRKQDAMLLEKGIENLTRDEIAKACSYRGLDLTLPPYILGKYLDRWISIAQVLHKHPIIALYSNMFLYKKLCLKSRVYEKILERKKKKMQGKVKSIRANI